MKHVSIHILFLFTFILGFSLHMQAKPGREFVASDIYKSWQPGDKLALLMVHFGSAYPEARIRVLDAMNTRAKNSFDKMEVREAYSSRLIIQRLAEQGILKDNPTDALRKLKEDGYTHVIIQSTSIIEGIEMEALRREAENMEPLFKDLRVGNPLLYDDSDYRDVINAIRNQKTKKLNDIGLLAAHGTYHASNSAYAMLGYMLQTEGCPDYLMGTIEGFPTINTVTQQIKASGKTNVTLIPFMFVLINNDKNEITQYWKKELEKTGLQVVIYPKGLGENPGIQDIILEHIHFSTQYKRLKIMEKKKQYAKSNKYKNK